MHDILVDGSPGNAKAGQIVNAQLVSQPSRYTQPVARIVEVLGSIDDPGIEIEIAVRKFGLPHIFSREALLEADKLPDQVAPDDYEDRVDLISLWSRLMVRMPAISMMPFIASRSNWLMGRGTV